MRIQKILLIFILLYGFQAYGKSNHALCKMALGDRDFAQIRFKSEIWLEYVCELGEVRSQMFSIYMSDYIKENNIKGIKVSFGPQGGELGREPRSYSEIFRRFLGRDYIIDVIGGIYHKKIVEMKALLKDKLGRQLLQQTFIDEGDPELAKFLSDDPHSPAKLPIVLMYKDQFSGWSFTANPLYEEKMAFITSQELSKGNISAIQKQ